MKYILFSLTLLSGTLSYGQKILTVDLDRIKQQITDKSSPYYYPSLTERFVKGDTSLSTEALQCLYYGASIKENQSIANINESAKLLKLFNEAQFKKAVSVGQRLLRDNPVDIRTSFSMMVSYKKLGIEDSARLYAIRYYGLLSAITTSGDGLSEATAMVVTSVPDEYDVLREAGFEPAGQSLLQGASGHTDRLQLRQERQQDPKVEALYFNVEMSFIKMNKLFEGELTLPRTDKPKK